MDGLYITYDPSESKSSRLMIDVFEEDSCTGGYFIGEAWTNAHQIEDCLVDYRYGNFNKGNFHARTITGNVNLPLVPMQFIEWSDAGD